MKKEWEKAMVFHRSHPQTEPGPDMGNRMNGVTNMTSGNTITLTMDQLKSIVNMAMETTLRQRGETLASPIPHQDGGNNVDGMR